MRARGFEAAPIAAEVEALAMDDWRASTYAGAAVKAIRTLSARAPHDSRDLLQAVQEARPDALIVDVLAWGALSAAERWGGPWTCSCPFPLPVPSREGPPVGPGFAPARGLVGRLRDRFFQALFTASFERLAAPGLAKARGELGLEPLANAAELFAAAPLHIYMTAEPFEYPRPDWPESIVMVGPCAWEPEGPLPAALASIREPLVLVSTSTDFQDDGRLVQAAMDALAGERLHVVATLPSADPENLRVPANGTLLRFAPHSAILTRAVCAITHGGMGVTQKALALGVPVCAVPFGRDQAEVARRVEVAGAGSRLPARRLTSRRLRAEVQVASACRPGAERIATAFAAAGGAGKAANEIERRLLAFPVGTP
ncbi:MAG TPA: nucleotide disphospho-sugar-binding domain-containing protein [Solirubrobacterales bacterium]|nr:nucleotide disphospho-sugar-binding domain-containing protein [Solirubrobacterales bacterium]